jgi:serine protease AprX
VATAASAGVLAATALLPAGAAVAGTVPNASGGTSPAGAYIVEATPGHLAQAQRDVVRLGGTVTLELPIVNGFDAQLPADVAAALAGSRDVRVVTPDQVTSLESSSFDPNTDAGGTVGRAADIGFDSYWWNLHDAGEGIGVALIDSGVSPVPGLAAPGQVVYGPDFTPTGYFTQVRGLDTYGHGTFMAGLIAGRAPGATAPYYSASDYYLGSAPGAHIVSVKVADASGATMESAVIAGIQWVVQHRGDPGLNIKVLNLSLGVRDGLPYTADPLDAAVEAAWKSGITVVTAAGNDGKIGMTAPANDPYVLAVAALDTGSTMSVSDDKVASFSNRGDGTRNPDLATLGTHIVGLRVVNSALDQGHKYDGGVISTQLWRGSGTSEASAITAGAAALLIAQRPGITPDQVKATLMVHATWMGDPASVGQGALNMGWVANAATEYRTQTWPSASVYVAPASWSVLSAGVSSTPSGSTWTGSTWTAVNWAGSTWTGSTWTGSTWTGVKWTGSTWTGVKWTGSTWTGSTWTGSTWTTVGWS